MAGKWRKAFSLVEVIFALLIMAWSMLTTVQMVDMRLRAFYKARTRAIVLKLAQGRADELMGMNDLQTSDTEWHFFDAVQYPRFSHYQYKLEVSTLPLRPPLSGPEPGVIYFLSRRPPTENFEIIQKIVVRVRGPVDNRATDYKNDNYQGGYRFSETRLPIIVVVKNPNL